MVRFQVENTGIGLQNIDPDKLFSRFQQGKHQQGGSGIGLAYCKELVEKHDGRIGAYDEGTQTIFYVELPYANSNNVLEKFDNEKTDTQVPEKTVVSDMSLYSLLLVDDNTDFLNYLYCEVRPLFKNVLKAVNGEEALLLLKNSSARPYHKRCDDAYNEWISVV